MNDATTRFQRLTAVLGVPTAIVMVGAALLKGKSPNGGASSREVVSFFTANHTALLVDGVLSLLAVPLLLLFVAGLRSRATASGASQAAASLLMGATAVLVTVLAVQTAVFQATVQHVVGRGDAPTVQLANDVNWMLYAALGIGITAVLIGLTAFAAVTGLLPRWAAWLSGAVALLALVGSCAHVYDDTGSAGIFGLMAWIGIAVWILAVSVVLMGRNTQAAASRRVAASV